MQRNTNPNLQPPDTNSKFRENIISMVEGLSRFYRIHIKVWSHSIISLIIFSITGLVIGIGFAAQNKSIWQFYSDEGQVIFYSSIVLLVLSFIYIYFRHVNRKRGIAHNIDKKAIKYLFYSASFFCFALYYLLNKDYFINTYEPNKFGIDQNQYILFVNIIGYLLITSLINIFIFKNYSMKKIGKDGVELEEEVTVAGEQNSVINLYIKSIKDYSDNICDLDLKMAAMYQEGLIIDDYSVDEYCIFVDEFLSSFISSNPDLSISIMSYDIFDDFAVNELSFNRFALSKVIVNTDTNRVHSHEDRIFVKYYSTIVEADLMIVVDCVKTYPWDLGLLIYSYMAALETCYSKYLV